MSSTYYGVTVPGSKIGDVTTGSATTSKNVELVVLDGVAGNSKQEIVRALDLIAAAILTADAPA
jgi:hypothetical protein